MRRALRLSLWTLLVLAIARLWLMPLPSGFWVDEAGTVFVVRHGAAHPSFAAAPQVPASLYYALPRAMDHLFGLSEIAYRLPSTLALAAALFCVFLLARRLFSTTSAWLAVFACLSLRGFNYQAADARPYALGTALAALSLYSLVRFFDTAQRRHAALFLLSAALLWRVHLVFFPFYALYPLYAAVRLRRSSLSLRQLAPWFAALALALLPVLLDALALLRQAGAHVIVDRPSLSELAHQLHLSALAAFLAASALLARLLHWKPVRPLPAHTLVLAFGWWLSQPLGLFLFSWLSGSSLFVPRYLALALPGVALAFTIALSLYIPPTRRRLAALAFGAAILLLQGHWNRLWPTHHDSGWREASALLNSQPPAPVLCPSPFIEARPPNWTPAYHRPGFLFSHLDIYPLRAPVVPLPFELHDGLSVAARALPDWLNSGRFYLYGGDRIVRLWHENLALRPELAAWSHRRLGRFGDVEVVVFEAPSPIRARLGRSPDFLTSPIRR